jgi:zinc protease
MNTSKRLSSIFLLLVLTSLTFAQAAQPAQTPAQTKSTAAKAQAPAKSASATQQFPTLKFEKYKLPNGLEVIMQEDHRLPLVAVNLWYHVGPSNERPGRTGFAHLFEHMMFSGSKHVANNEHFKDLEGAGASDINGTTDFDRTNYFETLPSNQLELALWLESDRMGYLLDTLDGKKLVTQRDVVRNERRQSVENQPYGLADEEVFHKLYPKGHPYYASVIGSHADIEAARLDDIRGFFKQYYAPNNASIAIVGDINKAEARALVEKYFGSIPAGPAVPKIDATTPPITAEKRSVVTDQVELPRVYMAWVTDPIFKPGDAEADLVAKILGGGKASRLYKKLVYEKKLAQDVRAQQNSLILGSAFDIEATARPGVKPEDLEKAIQEELNAIRTQGPTQAELERARATIESQIIRGLETLGGFGGVADRLNQYNHYLGDPGFLSKDLQRYENATVASIKKMAADKLGDSSRVVVYAVPGKKVITDVPRTDDPNEVKEAAAPSSAAAGTNDAWRAQAPKAGPATKLSLPVPVVSKLSNGLTLMLVERHNLPIVSASLFVNSGSELNPVDHPGLSAFTAAMLQEGTTKRAAPRIAEDADQIGAALNTGSTSDFSTVSIRSLKKNADAALELISDLALHPAFDPNELIRVRDQRITQIQQQRDNPNVLSSLVFNRSVYGEKHPYGYLELGTESSLKSLTRDDLAKFWKTGYVPANAALVVAGDMTSEELKTVAEKYFGSWTGSAPAFTLAPTEVSGGRRVLIVDKPGAPQTALRVGHIGIKRSSPDYPAAEVLNTALGGLFSSRININLREKHGYTYGAGSRFAYRRGEGPFYVSTSVRTDVTGPSVKEIFNELNSIRDTALTPEEIALSKDSIVRSMPGLFETSPNTVNSIGQLFVYSLPNTYYRTFPSQIEAVSPEVVKNVATKLLKPDSMIVVAVGDRAKIEPELQKLELGPIELRDFEAKPVKAAAAAGSNSNQ